MTTGASQDPSEHPHAPAGSPAGGQFAQTGGGGSKTKPAPKKTAPHAHRTPIPKGQMGFDGVSGTGYGHPDDNVKTLQTELNRTGFTDGGGKGLKVDGGFGPLTTAAVKKAQKQLGMNPTGIISPAFIARLKTLPTAHKPAAHRTAPHTSTTHKAAPKKTTAPKAPAKPANHPVHTPKPSTYASAAPDGALHDVELARPGDWKLASGDVTFDAAMLKDAADFFTASGGQAVPVKLGHLDDRFDGEPTFGTVTNVRYGEDDRGPVLIGDITGMPGWLAAAAPKRWPNRSIEGWRNFDYQGRIYSLVLSGLAFLGVTPPGVKNIASLADLQTALAASSAMRLVASAPAGDPAEAPHETPPEPEPAEPVEDDLADEQADEDPQDSPASEAEEPETQEGAGMDPAKIREALGLSADASDDEVRSTLTAAGLTTAPVAASTGKDAPGTMRVDASAWQEREERLARLEAAAAKARESERDQIIASAVKDGKFAPTRKPHWARLWDADPEGTREVIAGLAKNVMPTSEVGYADHEEELDAEFASLFPPVAKGATK